MALIWEFPCLAKYYQADQGGGIVGIGGAVSIVGLLSNVPLHVGPGPVDPCAVVRTTFYVLDGDKYMLILGHEFLAAVQGLVDILHHRL